MSAEQYVDMLLAGGRPIEGNRHASDWSARRG
jgi:hypothetical protein